jgi:hypothetical protein
VYEISEMVKPERVPLPPFEICICCKGADEPSTAVRAIEAESEITIVGLVMNPVFAQKGHVVSRSSPVLL